MAVKTQSRIDQVQQEVLDNVVNMERKDFFYYKSKEHMFLLNDNGLIKCIDLSADNIDHDEEDMVTWINVEDLIDDMMQTELELDEILPLN